MMMKVLTTVEKKAQEFSTQLINSNLSNYSYHNMRHTQEVVQQVNFLCEKEKIDQKSKKLLQIAAWFHDTGFINDYLNHENESIVIAEQFLRKTEMKDDDIQFVIQAIDATKLNSEKLTISQKVISDADCFHFGLPRFIARSVALKHEWEMLRNVQITVREMLSGSIMFLERHEFQTAYGLSVLEEGKQKNIQSMIHLETLLENHDYIR